MSTSIFIPIPNSLAQIYENASEEDKRKAQWLIELVLHDLFTNQSESLTDVIRDISQRAAERGMTPEILEKLFHDDE
jgi:hypothetical protein